MKLGLQWSGMLVVLLIVGSCSKADHSDAGSGDAGATSGTDPSFSLPETVSFNQHIRPILSDSCFACHGPDVDNQLSPFRLDTEEASRTNLAKEGDPPRYGIVPGKPEESLLIERVTHEDVAIRMPPVSGNKKAITAEQAALLRKWIADGAKYEKHWAFVAPEKPAVPTVANASWAQNDVDRFVLAKLETMQIAPSPEADKETLIRRVSMDLTGLPPSPAEIDAFVTDESDVAYEALVDRVMQSAHYGERMAIDWLDSARYADTNAVHVDLERSSWPWRDWVIRAFNENMPYDQFITEQIAGDLLPDATVEQKIATAFNRNHGINNEGGTIPEEFLVEYAVDRVSTMGSAMMGLTLACARCHDHKFDPITQDDFFSLFSFFNNIPEKGLESQNEFQALAYKPFIYVYTDEQKKTKETLDGILAEFDSLKRKKGPDVPKLPGDEKAVAWEALTLKKVHSDKAKMATIVKVKTQKGLKSNIRDTTVLIEDTKRIHFRQGVGKDAALDFTFKAPATPFNVIRVEALIAAGRPGRNEQIRDPETILSGVEVSLVTGKKTQRLEVVTGLSTLGASGESIVAALDDDKASVWNWGAGAMDHHFFLVLKEPVTAVKGELVVRLHYRGEQIRAKFYNDFIFYAGNNQHGYAAPIALIPAKQRLGWHKDALLINGWNAKRQTKLRFRDVAQARSQDGTLKKTATRCMVMEEKKDITPTYVLDRGAYDAPLEERPRERETPSVFPPMPEDAPKNRLGLAQWLVSKENPLTSRVAVNRFWQQIFEHGIVKTSEDFGLQSELPSHPGLLDYLAVDFQENGWDVKRLMKMMVMSATYRQSSQLRPDLQELDPDNRLLAQASRYRFPAEVIRDNALAASGLLNDTIGGPSVRPYQPAGLWREKTMRASASTGTYVRDEGDKLYRRGMYTFWKQAVPPPQMELFDAPSRENCTIKRRTTITPLQALMLMNDETYLELSRELATRLFKEVEGAWEDQLSKRIETGLRLTTGRKPSTEELGTWIQFSEENLKRFSESPENAKSFLSYGEKPRDESLPELELAALTYTMSAVFNLDETITRD